MNVPCFICISVCADSGCCHMSLVGVSVGFNVVFVMMCLFVYDVYVLFI